MFLWCEWVSHVALQPFFFALLCYFYSLSPIFPFDAFLGKTKLCRPGKTNIFLSQKIPLFYAIILSAPVVPKIITQLESDYIFFLSIDPDLFPGI